VKVSFCTNDIQDVSSLGVRHHRASRGWIKADDGFLDFDPDFLIVREQQSCETYKEDERNEKMDWLF
jgi:hypothetical protein